MNTEFLNDEQFQKSLLAWLQQELHIGSTWARPTLELLRGENNIETRQDWLALTRNPESFIEGQRRLEQALNDWLSAHLLSLLTADEITVNVLQPSLQQEWSTEIQAQLLLHMEQVNMIAQRRSHDWSPHHETWLMNAAFLRDFREHLRQRLRTDAELQTLLTDRIMYLEKLAKRLQHRLIDYPPQGNRGDRYRSLARELHTDINALMDAEKVLMHEAGRERPIETQFTIA